MTPFVVVAYTATAPGRAALARARSLAAEVLVLASPTDPPPDDLLAGDGAKVQLDTLAEPSVEALFGAAVGHQLAIAIVGDDLLPATALLRRSLAGAADVCRAGTPVSALLAVRATPAAPSVDSERYRRVLAAADGTVGSGCAALVAADLCGRTGAALDVVTVERRRNVDARRMFELQRGVDPEFDPTAKRRSRTAGDAVKVDHVRSTIEANGVPATFTYLVGDPSERLAGEVHRQGYDLLVSGLMGSQSAGRKPDRSHRLTRDLLANALADHLIVFDAVTLGVSGTRRGGEVLASTAELVFN